MSANTSISRKVMPVSLKIVLGILIFKIVGILTISAFQFWFVANPPTSGTWYEFWEGMKASLGANAMRPAYVLGYMLGPFLLSFPPLVAILKPSRFWLIAARVCTILDLLVNLGQAKVVPAIGDAVIVFVLFSKSAKYYLAKDVPRS